MKRLTEAASAGDADAQFNLAVLYDSRLDDNGHPVGGNRAAAIKWLRAAAQQGLPRAQTRLAELYVESPSRSGGHAAACFWFLLARASLAGIHRERAQFGYDRATAELTPHQIAAATKRAQLWMVARRGAAVPGRPAKGQRQRVRQ